MRTYRSVPSYLLLTILIVPLAGCSYMTFHDANATKQKNVGVEYYKPKLYLLVTQTGAGAYKADILTLPDLEQPRYALLHPGYGKNNLSLKLSNGMLTDVGQQTDTQIPETITALGSVASATGGMLKSLTDRAVKEAAAGETQPPPFMLFEIVSEQGHLRLRKVLQ